MRYLFFMLMIFGAASCELPPREVAAAGTAITSQMIQDKTKEEEYVLITTAVNMPLYVNHDEAAFLRWGTARSVKVSILGPADWDVSAQINTIEAVIGTRPSGLLINGTDPALASAINKAVAAGIPTAVYDSDIPDCNRDVFLGTDWYAMGRAQGKAMARLLKGKGKIAFMGILGQTNMEAGFKGLRDVLKDYPGIEIVGGYDDKANVEEAAHLTADILSAHPEIAGFCGFDSNSGPGIALSIEEEGRAGKVMITAVDREPEHLRLVKKGVIQFLVGQKRELFTWYGAQFLYDRVHHTNPLISGDGSPGITELPASLNTGMVEITKDNVDVFLK